MPFVSPDTDPGMHKVLPPAEREAFALEMLAGLKLSKKVIDGLRAEFVQQNQREPSAYELASEALRVAESKAGEADNLKKQAEIQLKQTLLGVAWDGTFFHHLSAHLQSLAWSMEERGAERLKIVGGDCCSFCKAADGQIISVHGVSGPRSVPHTDCQYRPLTDKKMPPFCHCTFVRAR